MYRKNIFLSFTRLLPEKKCKKIYMICFNFNNLLDVMVNISDLFENKITKGKTTLTSIEIINISLF